MLPMGQCCLAQKFGRQFGHGADQIDTSDAVLTIALQWLTRNANLADTETLNRMLIGRRIEDVLSVVPVEKVKKVYPFIVDFPGSAPIFDLLLEDDGRMFPNHASTLANAYAKSPASSGR